jgi:hypothetical protein
MLNEKGRERLEKIAVEVSTLRSKRGTVDQQLSRITANVRKIILDGGDPGEQHKAKKDELAQIDVDIAKLQAEAQGIVSSMITEAQSICAEWQGKVIDARRVAGEKLREFAKVWFDLGKITCEFGDAKTRRDFNAYLDGIAKRIDGIKINRLDPNGAIPLRPSWHGQCLRTGNVEEMIRIMVRDLTGFPFVE